MTALPRRRRLRTALVVFAAFATVVTAVVAGRVGARALGNYTGAKNAASETPVLALPDTPTAMLATAQTGLAARARTTRAISSAKVRACGRSEIGRASCRERV